MSYLLFIKSIQSFINPRLIIVYTPNSIDCLEIVRYKADNVISLDKVKRYFIVVMLSYIKTLFVKVVIVIVIGRLSVR